MAIKSDFHVHSAYSGDSNEAMEVMVQKAISLGMKDICFTEHMDLDFPVTKDCPEGYFEVNVDAYLYELLNLRNKYCNDINVLFGLELGMQPACNRPNVRIAKEHDFDFIIASSHLCNGKDPYFPEFFEGRSEEEAVREYFQSISEVLRAYSNFDVYGHLDYVIRYCPTLDANYSYDKYKDVIDPILKRLIDREKGIELNTSGLANGLKDMHPCSDILKRYRELGGEIITIGSDAHKAEDLGRYFDKAAAVLSDCGFQYYTTFDARIPVMHKL